MSDLKLIAEKIMRWKCPHGCVDGFRPKLSDAEYKRACDIWLAQGGEPWPEIQPKRPCAHYPNPLASDADCLELLKRLLEFDSIRLSKGQGNFWVSGSDFITGMQDFNAAVVAFAEKLAKEGKV